LGVGAVSNFVSTSYGNILGVKLVLVALAVALGAVNRFFILPSFRIATSMKNETISNAQRSFILILRIESGILLLVLFAATLLSFTAPVGS
jgi:putative copper resistance protein D